MQEDWDVVRSQPAILLASYSGDSPHPPPTPSLRLLIGCIDSYSEDSLVKTLDAVERDMPKSKPHGPMSLQTGVSEACNVDAFFAVDLAAGIV